MKYHHLAGSNQEGQHENRIGIRRTTDVSDTIAAAEIVTECGERIA